MESYWIAAKTMGHKKNLVLKKRLSSRR